MPNKIFRETLVLSIALVLGSSVAFAESYSTSRQGTSNQDESVQRWSTRPSARTQQPSVQYHAESRTKVEGGAPANSTWVVPVMPVVPLPVYPRGPMPGDMHPRR